MAQNGLTYLQHEEQIRNIYGGSSQMDKVQQGGCLCGHVRYELDMTGSHTGICHCRDCQRASGGPFMVFTTPARGHLRWITEPEGRASASDRAMRRFCARCGTPMTWESTSDPMDVEVSTGTLDDPSGVKIVSESFTARRWACLKPVPGLHQFEGDIELDQMRGENDAREK